VARRAHARAPDPRARSGPKARDAGGCTGHGGTVLFEEGQYDGALDALGGNEAAWLRQPVDGHIVAARALRALGRPEEALRVVGSVPVADGEVALLRAQLTSVVHGAEAAGPLFEALAASDRNSPGVYLAWGAVQATPRSRQLVLERAVGRFPSNVELLTALAEAAAAAGDWPSAIDAADGAIALDEQRIDAWIVEVDAAVRVRPSDVDRTLDRFAEIFAHDPARVVGMAERIAGLARSDNDPLVVRATRWLDGLPEAERRSELAMLARARVLAASRRGARPWPWLRRRSRPFPLRWRRADCAPTCWRSAGVTTRRLRRTTRTCRRRRSTSRPRD